MSTTDDAPHAHDWQPIQGWSARYRCADQACRAIGWKRIVRGVESPQQRDESHPFEIVPYVCTRAKCGLPAVTHSKSNGQMCRGHSEGRPEVTHKMRGPYKKKQLQPLEDTFAATLVKHGLPPLANVTKLEWRTRAGCWYAVVSGRGWFWLDKAQWVHLPMGPL